MGKLKKGVSPPLNNETETSEPVLSWEPPTLDKWLDSVDESAPWLVEKFIPEDALAIVSGQQKRAFKTWWAFLVALVLATGKKIGSLTPNRTGPVIIIEEEGTKPETKGRFLKLCKMMGIAQSELSNIYFAHRQNIKLDNEAWRKKLIALVRHVKPVLVIYDGLSQAHTGNENAHEDMSPVFDYLASIRNEGCSVLLLVHLNKEKGDNPKADLDSQLRGSIVTANRYDAHIALRRYKESQAHIDCYTRFRDHEWERYSLSWDVGDENPRGASFSMLQVIEGDRTNVQLLDKCIKALEIDTADSWNLKRMRVLWSISGKSADTVCAALVKKGAIFESNGQFHLGKALEEKEKETS